MKQIFFEKKWFFVMGLALSVLLTGCEGNTTKSSSSENSMASKGTAFEKGKEVYSKTCVTCHLASGGGVPNVFPPLAKSDFLAQGKAKAIRQVIKGRTGELTVNGATYNNIMPPQNLNDSEIANVLTYVYASFGNSVLVVSPEDVKSVRDTLK